NDPISPRTCSLRRHRLDGRSPLSRSHSESSPPLRRRQPPRRRRLRCRARPPARQV
uniref:Uncharacterized protein n=1 Tax=Aegilops tauschii subsp. strangulata TaxID=200361 RepID=A0A453HIS8_AEGTS